ncbi:hypothetical protein EPUS_00966 [Endocarpon pusillum Z07020]|uniref:DUF7924 domain-containing protein n=1 Tax=Endocarpon pusillum (strain Z07020 / HMAS-L-300199) TaxID=1263415 RepID=U1G8E6_ENDPU|nr:uncharacterized protein EPUS_00966 [Endocarpon pusillum Z07020]ERF73712.1 hypothetical protein EPUS_00966 [Endocarpon pusillum Z07020]
MIIALRGVVELFRKARRLTDVHRKLLAFSISHDHSIVRLYAHYPEIDGDKTSIFRYKIKQFDYSDERWTCYTFTRNIYDKFVPVYLELITNAIDLLPDPIAESFNSAIAPDDETAPSPQEPGALKQSLQQELKQQRKEAELQRKEVKQRETALMTQLEQQRKEFEQQRNELMQLIQQQGEHLNQLLSKH